MKYTFAAVIITAALIGGGCSKETLPTQVGTTPRLKIAATILPLADIARNIGGDSVEVLTLVPPGASPHTFEPTPELVKNLHDAKILFVVGHGLDDWALGLAQNLPNLKVVAVDTGIKLRQHAETVAIGGHKEEHGEEGADPHYWLDAQNGQIIAKNIANALTDMDSEGYTKYAKNLAEYLDALAKTDQMIRNLLADKQGSKIITHHHAWGYFAAAYGLVIAGSFEPSPGKNLTPKEMAELENLIKKEGVKSVFIEPQLSEAVASSIAQDLGLQIKAIDPEGALFGGDYLKMLEGNAKTIAESI
jgi:zinc transport system substrate-binding protein